MILVRDRLELVPYGSGVPAGLLPVLALMDGARSLTDLATEVTAMCCSPPRPSPGFF